MKKTFCAWLLGCALATSSSAALAQEGTYQPPADEMAEAIAIMEAIFPSATREETMLEIATTMGNQAAEGMLSGPIFEEPGIRAIMDRFLAGLPEAMRPAISRHLPNMIEATAIAYTRKFTLQELKDIRAFAGTETGARYFAASQSLLSDPAVADANAVFFQDIAVLQQEQAQSVQQEVVEYLQNNPDVLERLENAGVGSGS